MLTQMFYKCNYFSKRTFQDSPSEYNVNRVEGLVYENKTFLVAMLVLCLVLAGCSNSSNSSKDR